MKDFQTYSILSVTREHFIAGCCVSPLTWEACWEPHLGGLEPKLGSKSSMAKLAKCGILLQTACHNPKGQNGVTVTSNSQPPMVLLSTHTCTLAHWHTHRCTHNDAPHYFPWLNCMAGSSLTESRAVCLRKVQLPQLRRSGTLPPFTSLPAAPLLSPQPFSLSLQCLTHGTTCESRWTHVTNCTSTAYISFVPAGIIWFLCSNLFKVVHH